MRRPHALPEELRDGADAPIPRRIDGSSCSPSQNAVCSAPADRRRALVHYRPSQPPSTGSTIAATRSPTRGDARNTAAPARSSPSPQRPAGMRSRIAPERSGSARSACGVVGRDVAGRDRVDVDAARRPLVGERLGRARRCRTSPRRSPGTLMPPWKLSRMAVKMILPRPRSSIAAADRLRQHELARQVDLDHAVPQLERVLGRRRALDGARVVDEDVDGPRRAASPRQRGRRRRGRRSRRRRPRTRGRAPSTAASMALPVALERRAHADDVGAGRGEGLGHREADAAAGAGHDRGACRSGRTGRSCVPPARPDVDEHLHRPRRSRGRRTPSRVSASGTIRGDQQVGGDGAVRDQLDGASRSPCAGRRGRRGGAARARTRAAGRSRAASGGWRRRRSCRAPSRAPVAPSTAAAAPGDLEDDVRAGAAVHSSTQATWSVSRGSSVAKPSASICARRAGVELDHDDLGAEVRGRRSRSARRSGRRR